MVHSNEKPPAAVVALPDSFADYPRSISAIRSDKSRLAADWTVRDVVIDFLRDLDSGRIKPEAVLLVYRDQLEDGGKSTGFAASSADPCITSWLFVSGEQLFLAGGYAQAPVKAL